MVNSTNYSTYKVICTTLTITHYNGKQSGCVIFSCKDNVCLMYMGSLSVLLSVVYGLTYGRVVVVNNKGPVKYIILANAYYASFVPLQIYYH